MKKTIELHMDCERFSSHNKSSHMFFKNRCLCWTFSCYKMLIPCSNGCNLMKTSFVIKMLLKLFNDQFPTWCQMTIGTKTNIHFMRWESKNTIHNDHSRQIIILAKIFRAHIDQEKQFLTRDQLLIEVFQSTWWFAIEIEVRVHAIINENYF